MIPSLTRKAAVAIRKIPLRFGFALEHAWHILFGRRRYDLSSLMRMTGVGNHHDLWRAVRAGPRHFSRAGGCRAGKEVSQDFPSVSETVLKRADRVRRHVFDLLGSGPCELSSEGEGYRPIDWHLDFKSGHRWPTDRYHRWIRFGRVKGADIIVPWELSRFQDALSLGLAHCLTAKPEYRKEFEDQVVDWIEHNRFKRGVNWMSAMDAAIRAANWLVTSEYLGVASDSRDDFLVRFYCSLYDHGRFIEKNLLRIGHVTHNHFVAGLAGLLFIGLYCPFFKTSDRWVRRAVSGLEAEIEKQVTEDGCDFEASTSYHLLVMEIFLFSLILCDRAGVKMGDTYRLRLKRMAEVVFHYIKPDGTAPQIGDNDNGRFFKFRERSSLDHGYILWLAAEFFGDSGLAPSNIPPPEEIFWLFGPDRAAALTEGRDRANPAEIRSFSRAGWHIWRHAPYFCFISCGATGQGGVGGHAHNDKLGFVLVINGLDVIVDPGTFAYTSFPEERNRFRSTGYHNTVHVAGIEQNPIHPRRLFWLPERVAVKGNLLNASETHITFSASISYAGVHHRRILRLEKVSGKIEIEDLISSSRPSRARLGFHLSPRVSFQEGVIRCRTTGNEVAVIGVEGHSLQASEYRYSGGYGSVEPAERLSVDFEVDAESRLIRTVINAS